MLNNIQFLSDTAWRLLLVAFIVGVSFRVTIYYLLRKSAPNSGGSIYHYALARASRHSSPVLKVYGFFSAGIYGCLKVFTLTILSKDCADFPASQKNLRRVFCVICAGLLVAIGWGFYEPYTYEVTRTEIHSAKITKAVRIVQLSDLHSDTSSRLEEKLPGIIRELKPDLILLTGDYINSAASLPVCRKLFSELPLIAPSYGVKGNWEAWWFGDFDMFGGTGVKDIGGMAMPVNLNGNEIWLCGSVVDDEGKAHEPLRSMPESRYRIFLHHFPSAWIDANRYCDLHLAGDTHDGQIVLPLLGPVARIKRGDGKFYPHGLQQHGNIKVYVNRGIGMEGGMTPRIRFNCPPEIAVIDLLPQAPTTVSKSN